MNSEAALYETFNKLNALGMKILNYYYLHIFYTKDNLIFERKVIHSIISKFSQTGFIFFSIHSLFLKAFVDLLKKGKNTLYKLKLYFYNFSFT